MAQEQLSDEQIIEHLGYLLDEGISIIIDLIGEVGDHRETWRENDYIAECAEFKKHHLRYRRRKEARDD